MTDSDKPFYCATGGCAEQCINCADEAPPTDVPCADKPGQNAAPQDSLMPAEGADAHERQAERRPANTEMSGASPTPAGAAPDPQEVVSSVGVGNLGQTGHFTPRIEQLIDLQKDWPGTVEADPQEATPRTDAVCSHLNLSHNDMRNTAMNLLHLCRTLEREAAALRREVEELKSDRDDFHMKYRIKCDEETKALVIRAESAERELAEYKRKVPHAQFVRQTIERAEAAESELAACREDAERYRWLKANHLQTGTDSWIRTGNDLEEAIDAAIKAARKV